MQGGIKVKKGSHKNQIIITTLALLLAVVGYISYDNRDTFMNAKDVLSTEIEAVNGEADTQVSDEVALETDSTEEILNAGETVLTSASTESEECVAQVKLGREQVRSKNKEALQKIIDDAGVSEEEKKSAVDAMVKLTENAQMEEDAQMMLEAKGFKNAVVSLSDECCDVIVGKDDVTDEKRAQIEDIIKRKTNIGASNIVISTMD
ncbi:SpoIIIAH-like family protein [Agathobacter rectalis]|uniref:SpoIIIAH-like family protein n=1 Tax=Agathobacter rectalis TaxID=39491 RepID=A0A395UWL7_9FIRM|nr:SpoIIIAH-like family protein [Agathobacter rectalis]RGR65242.1 SpoIIIAH-like family protein [Agathobacter rectalis]RGS04926.1 SpoIIIAH-like family protein [Agathobacter rectalis]RGT11033.1 SpoIIIAH-like family protein [Agathobacter rectalis]RGT17953.1 SpoIIIAH-like family protein [Agathobacter rectalis]